MMHSAKVETFEEWRDRARYFIDHDIEPHSISWDGGSNQAGLFAETAAGSASRPSARVPKDFLQLAERVACHADPERWALLYSALWRITHGEKHLLELGTDRLTRRLDLMDKDIRRDAHKTNAFVRFRKVEDETGEWYIAWHKPDHKILKIVAPFFKTRFEVMRFMILTPQESLIWDGSTLKFDKGVPRSEAPQDDELEDLWRTYYRATFNPARIKLKAMTKEMPRKHWSTLPETRIIAGMLAEAPERVEKMIKTQEGLDRSAADFLPATITYKNLVKASKTCEGCELYKCATQTVFGEGALDASLMIVGEQPGNDEDLQGHPFVGPAGRILAKAFDEAEISRDEIYLTNAVKHFKFRLERDKRMHKNPDTREITACKPWLLAEIDVIKPKVILCLGVTAAKSLISHGFTLKKDHGRVFEAPIENCIIMPTFHPSAVLRAMQFDGSEEIYRTLVKDLRKAKKQALHA